MAVRPYKRSKRQAIRRRDLTARTVTNTLDSRNRPIADVVDEFTLDACTIQPAQGADLEVLPEGLRDSEVFNVFTNTPLKTAVRGTSQDSDEVFIPAPFTALPDFFTVLKVKVWTNDIVPHYKATVVRKNPDV